jgi:hypothetical protein
MKTETLTMRLSPETLKFIETFAEHLTKQRGPGAKPVSKSEAVAILIEIGKSSLLNEKNSQQTKNNPNKLSDC